MRSHNSIFRKQSLEYSAISLWSYSTLGIDQYYHPDLATGSAHEDVECSYSARYWPKEKKQAVQYHANVSFHFRLKVLIFHSPSSFFSFFLFQGDCIIYRILLYKRPGLNLINKKSLWKADSRFRKKNGH